MSTSHIDEFSTMLRSRGLKATPARLALLATLAGSPKPLSSMSICGRLSDVVDQATVYRSLDSLAEAGIVQKVDFRDGHTYYELLAGSPHHHHIVCKVCGIIEDVEACDVKSLESKALKQSKKFKAIKSHSLEFFGVCAKCS